MFPSHEDVPKIGTGNTIVDSYGREFGLILGSTDDPYSADKDEIIWIKKSNGDLDKCKVSQIQVEGSSLILTTSWIDRSRQINEALSTVLRKISALNILKNNNEISQDAFLKLQKQYKRKLNQLTHSHQRLLEDAGSRISILECQIEDIHFVLANIKIEESVIKEPCPRAFTAASSHIASLLSQAMREKRDLDQVLNQPQAKQIPSNPSPRRELPPIQPIVLHIKEAVL